MTDKIKFTDKEIGEIKDIISNKDLLDSDDLEDIRELKKKISINNVNLAILFVKCYNFIESNITDFKSEEKDFISKIRDYINQFKIYQIREHVFCYGFGKTYGDSLLEEKMNILVGKNRKTYLELIGLFSRIFSEE